MKKRISVITLALRSGNFYARQFQDIFGDLAEVRAYSTGDGSVEGIEPSDLYVVSTDAFEAAEETRQYVPSKGQVAEIHLTYAKDVIQDLKKIPKGTRVLFVNITSQMAREAITQLEQLGVNQLHFEAYGPDLALPSAAAASALWEGIDLAVTPDEASLVPVGIEKIINIGHRPCTPATIIEAALRLGLERILEEKRFQNYMKSMAAGNYSFEQMFKRSRQLESRFDILLEILDEGMIGVNERGEVFAVNQKAREITGVEAGLAMGRPGGRVFPYIPFEKVMKEKNKLPPRLIRVGSANINLTVVPVLLRGECIGAFATLQWFNELERRQNELRSQLRKKGYRAKYCFDDVIGHSRAIERTKEILKRMALTESPVLLIGETGTGKELFAHAVHHASKRREGPFVAINVAAVPENLLESELFGYEEGAFTGAKKGGRPGLFEFAHKGTLFLDEVEGMSPAMQVKLLRVLQEQEIMRVGGNQMINVDVRIVAATNESLEKKVEEGSFRRDLYYRLNALPALIPPLREREDDILFLLENFRSRTGGSFVLSEEVKDILMEYTWPGNIRELQNVVEYLSFTGRSQIGPEDLPPTFPPSHPTFRQKKPEEGMIRKKESEEGMIQKKEPEEEILWKKEPREEIFRKKEPEEEILRQKPEEKMIQKKKPGEEMIQRRESGEEILRKKEPEQEIFRNPEILAVFGPDQSPEFWYVLGQMYQASEEGTFIGREAILQRAKECHFPLSQKEVRGILEDMAGQGLAKVSKGRGGSRLTPLGRKVWEERFQMKEAESQLPERDKL